MQIPSFRSYQELASQCLFSRTRYERSINLFSCRAIDHFIFYFDSFLHQNQLEYVIRRCPVKFWAQYWPSWMLQDLKKFEKNRHHLLRITTFFITDCGILQVTWPLMSNQKLKQQNKTIIMTRKTLEKPRKNKKQ